MASGSVPPGGSAPARSGRTLTDGGSQSAVTARPFTHRLSLRDARRPGPRSTVEPEPTDRHKQTKVDRTTPSEAETGEPPRTTPGRSVGMRRPHGSMSGCGWPWARSSFSLVFCFTVFRVFFIARHTEVWLWGNDERDEQLALWERRVFLAKAPSIIPHPFVEVAAAPRGTKLPWSCAALVPR